MMKNRYAVPYLMTVDELAELLTPIGCDPLASRTQSTTVYPDWGFHTMWGGIDPWDHRLGPRFVGIVEIWKYI